MLNFKKFFLVSASIVALASTSFADTSVDDESGIPDSTPPQEVVSDLKIELNAYAHFQAGYLTQSKLKGEEKNVSANRQHFAFFNESALAANISNQINDVTYGGKIILVPTTKRKGGADYNGSHIYLKNADYGQVQLGSPIPASSTMFVDGSSIAVGTFDGWGAYAKLNTAHLKQGKDTAPSFADFIEFYMDSKLLGDVEGRKYSAEPGRSVVYYTPDFNLGNTTKLQLGVSYTPDSSNTGADSVNTSGVQKSKISITDANGTIYKFEVTPSVKDVVTGGITLKQEISDGIDVKISATGEYGKSTSKVTKSILPAGTEVVSKISDLRTFNVGAVLNVGNIAFAGGYGSLGKSLTHAELQKTGRKTDYYSAAVAYKQGPFATSLSYYKTIKYKNTVDAISLGTHYQLAPGFKPYAEISTFTLKGKPEAYPELTKKKSTGTVVLVGAKLSI